jgi:hypothetical protein
MLSSPNLYCQSSLAVVLMLPDLGCKAVTAFRYGLNVSRAPGGFAQSLAQRRDIDGEVGVLDIAVGPDLLHEFVFGKEPAVALNEDD